MCTWLKDETDDLQHETDDLQDATIELHPTKLMKPWDLQSFHRWSPHSKAANQPFIPASKRTGSEK